MQRCMQLLQLCGHSLTSRLSQALTGVGVVCSWSEMEGEDHFSITERLAEDDYQLTKVTMMTVYSSCQIN